MARTNNNSFDDVEMRTQMCVEYKDMYDWRMICRAWCKKNNATLLFVKSDSFGCQFPDGTFQHIYIDELVDMLGGIGS